MKGKISETVVKVIFATIIGLTACKKDEICSFHPDPFRFSIIDSETKTDLLAEEVYIIDSIGGIYYIYNQERNNLIVNREEKPDGDYLELTSVQLPMISLTGRSDTFYLELSPHDTDTLIIVVEKEVRGDCNYHPYTMVKHNGKVLPIVEGKAFILEK